SIGVEANFACQLQPFGQPLHYPSNTHLVHHFSKLPTTCCSHILNGFRITGKRFTYLLKCSLVATNHSSKHAVYSPLLATGNWRIEEQNPSFFSRSAYLTS